MAAPVDKDNAAIDAVTINGFTTLIPSMVDVCEPDAVRLAILGTRSGQSPSSLGQIELIQR